MAMAARGALLACLLAGLAHRTPSMMLQRRSHKAATGVCPWYPATAMMLRAQPGNAKVQAAGCRAFAICVFPFSVADQLMAAQVGFIEAVINAQRRFPDDKQVQVQCAQAIQGALLFNRPNGLRAGRLGGLNLTFAAYRRWMDDPAVTSLGGAIGSYFDFVNENRAIAGELGGIKLLIQNIKNNFHGQYSDWAYEPVKQSLFGLSSGCWKNQAICHEEGFLPLAVSLMLEHTNDTKIAEEALQAVKALIFKSDKYRREFVEQGGPRALVAVLRGNQIDQGAVSLVCETMTDLVGPTQMISQSASSRRVAFDAVAQAELASAGAVEALLHTVLGHKKRKHFEHGAFSFNVDLAYNADSLCLQAAKVMVSPRSDCPNAKAMLQAGLAQDLRGKLHKGRLNVVARLSACALLSKLAKTNSSVQKC